MCCWPHSLPYPLWCGGDRYRQRELETKKKGGGGGGEGEDHRVEL